MINVPTPWAWDQPLLPQPESVGGRGTAQGQSFQNALLVFPSSWTFPSQQEQKRDLSSKGHAQMSEFTVAEFSFKSLF